jgi:hypothetical protein
MKGKLLTGVVTLAILSLAGCGSGGPNTVTDARLDVNDVWLLIANHYVEYSAEPPVRFEDGEYVVNGLTMEARLESPEIEFTSNGPADWCVTIEYNDGSAAVSAGPDGDIKESAGC